VDPRLAWALFLALSLALARPWPGLALSPRRWVASSPMPPPTPPHPALKLTCRCHRPAATAAAAAGGEEAKPAEDTRSWLAKNWLFVAAFGMAILNTMLKATGAGEQAQGGRPAAPRR
jgi:hypothetical protein